MKNNMIIYVSKDGNVKVDVSIENEDIWMSQDVMANLYGTTKQNVSYHINNIFKEARLKVIDDVPVETMIKEESEKHLEAPIKEEVQEVKKEEKKKPEVIETMTMSDFFDEFKI